MIRIVAEMSGRSPRPRAKYRFDAPTLPVSLRQPAEPVRDLGLVLGRRAAIGLAIGIDRAREVASRTRAAAMFRQAAYVDGVSRSSRTASQAATRRALVVEAVAGLAEPEEGRGGDRRVVEADDPPVAIAAARKSPDSRSSPAAVEERRAPRRAERARALQAQRRARRRAGRRRRGRPIGRSRRTRLAHVWTVHPAAPDLGARRDLRRRAARRRSGRRFNVAPTDEAAVVVQREDRRADHRVPLGPDPPLGRQPEDRVADVQRPGRDARPPARPSATPSERKRCLVPVDSFYEWKRGGKVRQPYAIVRADGRPIALAGLWAGWRDPDDRRGASARSRSSPPAPNDVMAAIHDRMPVIIPEAAWDRWLDPRPA